MPTAEPKLKLDDKTVEAETSHYPPAAAEAVRWLAAFTREHCNRQISSLEDRVKKLKFKRDYSYFHRIFCGNYFHADPMRPGKIVGNPDDFVELVDALRRSFRLEERAGKIPFVETPTWDLIRDYIDKKRLPQRINKFGAIVGHTGMQKTAAVLEYCSRNNHGRVISVEAPERPNMGEFLTDLASKYGCATTINSSKKKIYIRSTLDQNRCIIIENIQRLYDPKKRADQPVFSYVQKLQEDTGITIIFTYTPDFDLTLENGVAQGYFEQFIGRIGGWTKILRLPDYPKKEDILCFAKAFGFADGEKHIKYLEDICHIKGRIRVLLDDLQDAKQLAGDGPLTIDHLRIVRREDEK